MIENKRILSGASMGFGHTIPVLRLSSEFNSLGNDARMLCYKDSGNELMMRHGVTPENLRGWTAWSKLKRIHIIRELLDNLKPDVTICDYDVEFWLALRFDRRNSNRFPFLKQLLHKKAWQPKCRVSVLRCEALQGYKRRNIFLVDKFGFEAGNWTEEVNRVLTDMGMPRVNDGREIFDADVIAIPSVPEIDPLPEDFQSYYPKTRFVYTGPLLLPLEKSIPSHLDRWIEARRLESRPILLVTFGTVWGSFNYRIVSNWLQNSDFAVIVVVPDPKERQFLEKHNNTQFQAVGLVDLYDLAQRVDVVMHHCGHATLQAIILAGKPSITLPSGEYDREDNALRLEDLNCGRHLGHDFFRTEKSSSTLKHAVKKVLTDQAMHESVQVMSRSMRSYVDGIGMQNFCQAVSEKLNKN